MFARDGERDLPFEIEVVLPAGGHRAAQAVRRAHERRGGIAARHVHRRQHVRLRGHRFGDREDRRQRLEIEAGETCGAARGHDVDRCDGEDRLPGEFHEVVREDRIVVLDRAHVVDARNVLRADHRNHTRRLAHGLKIETAQYDRGDGTDADRDVQKAAGLGQVVGVLGLTADMQRRRVVRHRDADAAGVGAREVGRVRRVHDALTR